MDNRVLQDRNDKKERPWRQKKVRSLKIADSFERLGYEKKAIRIRYCGDYLAFVRDLETGRKILEAANFCRERLCPMCQWRKSLKVFWQVSRVMDKVQEDHPRLRPIFLTLTLRNCSGADLAETVSAVFKGWNLLWKQRKMERIGAGWFRALEITYNRKEDTFHPHIHAIILVDQSYFKGKDYMQTVEWVQLWRTVLRLDYDPICDVRRVYNKAGKRKAVAEVAKYTLKDTEFATNDKDLTDKLVKILSTALRGRRLFAFGGIMKDAAKALGVEELAEGDLVHIDEDEPTIRGDVATALEVYRWNFGVANYIRDENFSFSKRDMLTKPD